HRRRIGNARMDQPGLGELEALPFLAEAIFLRDLAVLQVDLVREVRADHRDRLVAEALELLLDDERGDAVTALARPGAREHEPPVRLADARDPDLGAVQDVAIAALLGARLDGAARVRAAARLRDGDERLAAGRHRGNGVFLDL